MKKHIVQISESFLDLTMITAIQQGMSFEKEPYVEVYLPHGCIGFYNDEVIEFMDKYREWLKTLRKEIP